MMHPVNRNPIDPSPSGLLASRPDNRGAALIIVLAFVVLLTGVVVSFFVRATNDRQVADSSASQTKVEILARGALDTVVGDLRQEIADGSTATNVVTGSVTNIIYTYTGSNAVPALVGSTGANGLQNLVKISTNAPFHTRSGPAGAVSGITRASTDSTTNASLNFRSVSPARWNKALLLPPASTTDYTPQPAAKFTPPFWIYVNRTGSNPTAWSMNLIFSPTNPSAVIGRYAYAIYNEGGLLDLNVAGYPSTLSSSPSSYASNQLAYRGSMAYADLTQLTNAGGTSLLTTPQIDRIVSWRNAATLGDSTVPPASSTATNYVAYVSSSTTGFLATANPGLSTTGQSDRLFISRQQLINFFLKHLGGSTDVNPLNALQYVGSFSRSLNQPSIDPSLDTNVVKWGTGTAPWFYDYPGGNNGYTYDRSINPVFLTNRVASGATWTRNDGSPALPGDPLVKKRFPLDRLAWITAKGPLSDGLYSGIATTPAQVHSTDNWIQDYARQLHDAYGFSYAFLQQGTAANIRNCFGLVWSSDTTPAWAGLLAPNFWFYAPGAYGAPLATTPTAGSIANLGSISDREPNFIELLKAAIHVGGLAKSIGNVLGTYQYTAGAQSVRNYITIRDFSVDPQIIQTAANIIEQSALDGFPRRIVFDNGGGTGPRLYTGVEDLPYFYRFKHIALCVTPPNPLGAGYDGSNNPIGTYTGVAAPVMNPGAVSLLIIPEIWNPHDQNSRITNNAFRPMKLRLVADNTDPITACLGTNAARTAGIYVSTTVRAGTQFVLNPDTSELLFNDANGTLFREPTALRNPNIPAGSLLTTGLGHMIRTDTNICLGGVGGNGYLSDYRMTTIGYGGASANNQFVGIYLGTIPIITNKIVSGVNYVTNFMTASTIYQNEPQLTFRMQAQDPYENWVDYDVKGWARIASGQTASYGAAQVTGSAFLQYLAAGGSGLMGTADVVDPRTGRWGMRACYPNLYNFYQNYGPQPNRSWSPVATNWTQSNNVLGTHRTAYNGTSLNAYNENLNNPNGPADIANWTAGYDDGYLSVNSTNNGISTSSYRDPDGITRGGMSYYTPNVGGWPSSDLGLPLSTATADWNTATPAATAQSVSRPMLLHRPFATVAELGCVFSDSIWRNIDFSTPRSPYSTLLDLFCIHETPPDQVLVAGKIDLNTRQAPVLQGVLNGAYRDALNRGTSLPLNQADAAAVAAKLVARTTNTAATNGPLANVGDLVGYYSPGAGAYTGFSADLSGVIGPLNSTNAVIHRFREAAVRPLADCGQTRVWNLLIDVVAQSGRFPKSASSLQNFQVEGEQRYWLHVAIDRVTGQVLDSQLEQVRE